MVQQRTDLEEFFHPTAVALVGSVNRNAKPDKLRAHYGERWGDRWYLVNAKGGSVGDIPIYEHVTDIPAKVALAVVNVGTRYVLEDSRGVRRARRQVRPHIHGGILRGRPRRGPRWSAPIGEMARKYSMRVFGPNTNTNAFEELPEPAEQERWPDRARDPERPPGPTARPGNRVRSRVQPLGPDR